MRNQVAGGLALFFFGFSLQLTAQETGSEWSRFRGPNGSGVASEVRLPTDLNPNSAAWSIELPGPGHSCPVVWGDKIWLTSFREATSEWVLSCYDLRNGRLLWERARKLQSHPMHRLNNPATSTPAVDARAIYALVMEPEHLRLIAWNHQGEELWQRDFGTWVAQHGFAASPIVWQDKVIVLNSQEPWEGLPAPGDSRLLAVKATDGSDVWSCDLKEDKACYATPLVWRDTLSKEWLVCTTQGDGVLVVDPATGEKAWDQAAFKQRTVGSPILSGNRVIANNGSGGGGNYLVSMRLDDREHTTTWEMRQSASYVPTLIEVDSRVYVFADNGVVTCLDSESGKELWRERLSDGFWASPVSDGQSIYCLDKNGVVKVLKAGDKCEVLGSYDLGAPSQAAAAISRGRIFFRTTAKLYCFGANAGK
jgi:outer membrane protein assembly factor BamB